MSTFHHQQRSAIVATEKTSAQAELLQMTLVANGISATITPRAPSHPSIDFVQGIDVLVSAEDEELAREILRGVGPDTEPD